jgi:Zn finger protein HypA/HybF involved in hydrogenase expression
MFDLLSRKTIAEGARLMIERIPVTFHCDCGETFAINIKEVFSKVCPRNKINGRLDHRTASSDKRTVV